MVPVGGGLFWSPDSRRDSCPLELPSLRVGAAPRALVRAGHHAALRLAPDEVTPFAYSDPLAVAAVDMLPEVAVAYAESLRAANATEEEIKRKLGDAVNVRFVVTVALITRQQISVGGGDILRNIFTLEL